MKNHVSGTPDIEAGTYITTKIRENADRHILLLISGGSCLRVLSHIDTDQFGPNVAVAFTDERYTKLKEGSHFLRLKESIFYEKAFEKGALFLESSVLGNEDHTEFAERIKKTIEHYLSTHPNAYVLGLFGIGEDGHTAGIFSRTAEEFAKLYRTDEFYIPVIQENNPYPLRTTVTPAFIEDVINDVVLFAVGSKKCESILDYMYNKVFTEYQIPALIPATHPQSILFTDCANLDT